MQKYFFPLLLTGLLLFMAGYRQMTSDTTPTGEMPQEPPPAGMPWPSMTAVVFRSPYQRNIWISSSLNLGRFLRAGREYACTHMLMIIYDKAAEADYGNAEDLVFLWSLCALDRESLEQLLSADGAPNMEPP